MTLREWLSTIGGRIDQYDIKKMAEKIGVDYVVKDGSPCTPSELSCVDLQLDGKSQLVISMFQQKFGLDEEF